MTLSDCIAIQKSYSKLGKDLPFTKKNLCDILVPYKERFNLTDREVLSIARNELTLQQINELLERSIEE